MLDAFHPDMYIIMDGLNDLDTAQAVTLTRLKKISGQTVPDQESGYGIQNIEEKFVLVGYQRNLQRAIEHAKSKGIKVVLVSDPMRIAAEHPARLVGNNPDLAALLAFGRTVLPGINAALAETNGITFVNAQQTTFDPVLDQPRQIHRVWADDLHLTRYGYYLLARDVYRRLMAMPAVIEAAGTDKVASDDALDALFPELVLWRPSDGTGWPKDQAAIACAVTGQANIKDSKPNGDGWSFYSSADPAQPAELRLTGEVPGVFRLYSRIQGLGDSVAVFQRMPDGQSKLLFEHKKAATDGLWTPETAWYEVHASDGTGPLTIRLTGDNAQLWHKAGAILFTTENAQ